MPDSMPPADDKRRRPGQSSWDVITASLMVHGGLSPADAREIASWLIVDLFSNGHGVYDDHTVQIVAQALADES